MAPVVTLANDYRSAKIENDQLTLELQRARENLKNLETMVTKSHQRVTEARRLLLEEAAK